ncbi:hypothetical protein N7450_004542 [Penicillium hetheringtonii]|uniref:Beta-lactamase-related domain-containing protein n=1 Tax=Penicillium hetheringtonii TaxID=911720 RepID=A0AAD6DQ78_9EURO|nr:hypothetical protein N7450_004542 [Penicillium hetheringtonii]
MPFSLSLQDILALQGKVGVACDPQTSNSIPGVTVNIVDEQGNEQFSYAGGTRAIGSGVPMDMESIFWIASCTKIVTSIACLQLVEKGLINLDDASSLEAILPELKSVQVLSGKDGNFDLAPKCRGISLRMLLSHTAGFTYSFFNESIRDFRQPDGYDEFSGHMNDMLQPLVHQPGEKWEYGISHDWAGIVVERLSHQSLDEYFRENIFIPLGISEMGFFPSSSMKDRLVSMHQRASDGKLSLRNPPLTRPLQVQTQSELKECFNSGGGGLWAKPSEFCSMFLSLNQYLEFVLKRYAEILSTLLNQGISPCTGYRILKEENIEELYKNQIPQFPNFGRQGLTGAKRDLTNGANDLYPVEGNPPQGYSMAGMLTPTATGRSETSVFWSGMPNIFWWCDREKKVAGMISAQILPFGDASVLALWNDLEKSIYDFIDKLAS